MATTWWLRCMDEDEDTKDPLKCKRRKWKNQINTVPLKKQLRFGSTVASLRCNLALREQADNIL